MAQDYNQTLNLPNTEFPMRAGLPQMESAMLEDWETINLYEKMVAHTKGKPSYIFHDGPPYANAAIHLGTALNKVLKDIIVRYKNMSGFHAPYIPGWDTHGLPIELKAMKAYGLKLASDPVVLRQHCHDFALEHVETQKTQFKRLGTLAKYDDPYLTLKPAYEAKQIEVFGAMAQKGYIYKDLKSVYWCADCVTALAEAEVEYADDQVDSIYVKFLIVEDPNGVVARMGAELAKTFVVIWTTTTWTLPANMATTLGPDFEYVAVQANGEYLIIAKELVESTMQAAGITEYKILGSAKGKELEFVKYRHPFLDRISPLIVGDHVTLETGTGCVHTAPGHGADDFDVITQHYAEYFPDGILVPVDDYGKMTAEAGEWLDGISIYKANKLIQERLKENGNLLSINPIVHQYPHCWRCKKPILFRATEQWFCSVEDFKAETLEQIKNVQFIPPWGESRMAGMVQDRNAWCISRQRVWGVPIPVVYCNECEKYIVNEETIKHISALFAKEGSDSWFIRDVKDLLPEGFACPHCGSKEFTKETDTMDVWFDSGCSHAAVLETWEDQSWPADLYLEGGDQYRGWFQSSLLTSVAWRGKAPYKAVCTHGMVVDDLGRKQSKSLGNGIAPEEIVSKFGADILRLWVASSDYHADIRISDAILKQLSEAYRKIRNTARFILGNLTGFNPNTDMVSDGQLQELDRWAIARLQQLLERCTVAYQELDFHIVYHNVLNFCTVDMSNFYLDIIKDRLYVEKTDSIARRAAQTAMYQILESLTLLMAPILCFTSEEIWRYLEHRDGVNCEFSVLNEIPSPKVVATEAFMARWDQIIGIRDHVNKALEEARNEKAIGKSLEAKVTLYADGELLQMLTGEEELLKTVCIVSDIEIHPYTNQPEVEGLEHFSVEVLPADGEKCERCWVISPTVGTNSDHPTLCKRCAEIVG